MVFFQKMEPVDKVLFPQLEVLVNRLKNKKPLNLVNPPQNVNVDSSKPTPSFKQRKSSDTKHRKEGKLKSLLKENNLDNSKDSCSSDEEEEPASKKTKVNTVVHSKQGKLKSLLKKSNEANEGKVVKFTDNAEEDDSDDESDNELEDKEGK